MEKNVCKPVCGAPGRSATPEERLEATLNALTGIVSRCFEEGFERDFAQLSPWQRTQTIQRYVWYLLQQPKDTPSKTDTPDTGEPEAIRLFIPRR